MLRAVHLGSLGLLPDILFLKHASIIFRQSSNHVCDLSMMEKVRLCAVWPMENWIGSFMNHIQGRMTVCIMVSLVPVLVTFTIPGPLFRNSTVLW